VRPGLDWNRLNTSINLAREIRKALKAPTRIVCSIINQEGVDVGRGRKILVPRVDNVQIRKYLTWGYNEDRSADDSPYLLPEERIPCPWLFERLNIDTVGCDPVRGGHRL